MVHRPLCTNSTSAGLLGIHLGLADLPDLLDLTPSPCCRIVHMVHHCREEETTPTGGIMVPAMVHPIIICPNETMAGTAGNMADHLSRVQVILHSSLHSYLLDFLNVLISLVILTDVDQVLTVPRWPCILSRLTMARPPRGQRRMDHLRLLLEG